MGNRIGRAARLWWRYVRETKAVSALEYAILVGVIAVAIAVAMNQFAGKIGQGIGKIGAKVGNPTTKTLKVNP